MEIQPLQQISLTLDFGGKIYIPFFEVAVTGYNIICDIFWQSVQTETFQPPWLPPVNLTHTHTHTNSPYFLSPPLPTDCTIHYLPMNLSSSTSTLHFCASLSVTLLLPSISSHPSLLCQVSGVLTYTEMCGGFFFDPPTVILGKLTNTLM